jgi:hypothetical protein
MVAGLGHRLLCFVMLLFIRKVSKLVVDQQLERPWSRWVMECMVIPFGDFFMGDRSFTAILLYFPTALNQWSVVVVL